MSTSQPIPRNIKGVPSAFSEACYQLWNRFNNRLKVPVYTVSTAPSTSEAGEIIYVSDESGGAVIAFSDGTSWRRVTDRAVIS